MESPSQPDVFNPSQEEIDHYKSILNHYRFERAKLITFCKTYNVDIPKYDPPIDARYAPFLKTSYTKLPDGTNVFIPYRMNRVARNKFLNPSAISYKPLMLESDWTTLLSDGINSDRVARFILSKYEDIDTLIIRTASGTFDPVFKRFTSCVGFFTDWKSNARLREDWAVILPIVICKFIKQLKTSYRKGRGGYSTFFQGAFTRILILTYIDYCRSVHKESVSVSGTLPIDKFLKIEPDINPEDCPALSDGLTFDNELYYHVLSLLKAL